MNDLYDFNHDGKIDSNEYCAWDHDTFGASSSGGSHIGSPSYHSEGYSGGGILLTIICGLLYMALLIVGLGIMVIFPPVGAILIVLGIKIKEAFL